MSQYSNAFNFAKVKKNPVTECSVEQAWQGKFSLWHLLTCEEWKNTQLRVPNSMPAKAEKKPATQPRAAGAGVEDLRRWRWNQEGWEWRAAGGNAQHSLEPCSFEPPQVDLISILCTQLSALATPNKKRVTFPDCSYRKSQRAQGYLSAICQANACGDKK